MNNEAGYTLVELTVVMAMIAILTGIAGAGYINLKPIIHLNGAARQIMGDLMAARMDAVNQNNNYKIFFLDNNHQYQILDDDDNDGVADTGEAIKTKDIHDEYPGITFSAGSNPVFSPRGTASGNTAIAVSNGEGGSKTVTVKITGSVKTG